MEKNKKRGRKPKGGKIMDSSHSELVMTVLENIILHLKCSSKDISEIRYNHTVVEPFIEEECQEPLKTYAEDNLHQKIKNISARLHTNEINGRSDCFWCTCPFDTAAFYIPKAIQQGQYQVYGSFCCPECAAGYLFKERIDHSTKMERYHLLHDFYEYEKSIVPAPSPYYLLSKYYGSLTIQEYRQMIREKVCMMIDKPFCCQYPELVQTMDYSKQYKLCRKTT
jgi:hypothetical protein